MRRLRCLFRRHLWQPESEGTRYVCPRCGAHVSTITDAQRRFEDPGGAGGSYIRQPAPPGDIGLGGGGDGS